ncbi:BTB/POZ domain-containing protein [Acorus calamus]|uniref:BTB/POZ domain-containing protein n=1 Tax=Acorus calamus TaxID=4465 RepID=A0AAV9DU95_ACOCL|nr:BTB/POZ domain-containing protein [Acorus calamus]
MQDLCDLKVQINGHHTFFLNQKTISTYSETLRRLINQEKKKTHTKNPSIKILDFPGGPHAFELALRFCYNEGRILMTPLNLPLLYCSAVALEMTEEASTCNLSTQTETFLDSLFYWSWNDIVGSLKACEPFLDSADESGLLQKLLSSLLAKMRPNSEIPTSSSSSSSSPETHNNRKEWWFDDLTVLSPKTIEKVFVALGAYGENNKNPILTRFLLHYLKSAVQKKKPETSKLDYGGLADTAVHGVALLVGRAGFSGRALFWVLRTVSCLGLGRECRGKLERLMGLMMDVATVDDILVSGDGGGVYDVNFVLRLGLKVSKFLAVAESLPDSARDFFDGVYRAVDIYLESHPNMATEERTRLCRCLNYEKLTLEACKDLAKNPRIPPRIAMQALVSQQSRLQGRRAIISHHHLNPKTPSSRASTTPGRAHCAVAEIEAEEASLPPRLAEMDEEEMRLNFQRMQWRVVELEKVCEDMKGRMSKMAKNKGASPCKALHITNTGG